MISKSNEAHLTCGLMQTFLKSLFFYDKTNNEWNLKLTIAYVYFFSFFFLSGQACTLTTCSWRSLQYYKTVIEEKTFPCFLHWTTCPYFDSKSENSLLPIKTNTWLVPMPVKFGFCNFKALKQSLCLRSFSMEETVLQS